MGYAIALFDNKGFIGAIGLGVRAEEIPPLEEEKIEFFLKQGAKTINNRLKSKTPTK